MSSAFTPCGRARLRWKRAVAPLHAVVALVVDLLLEGALALDGEDVVVDFDLDVVDLHARQLGLEHDGVLGVEHVDRRQPAFLTPRPQLSRRAGSPGFAGSSSRGRGPI